MSIARGDRIYDLITVIATNSYTINNSEALAWNPHGRGRVSGPARMSVSRNARRDLVWNVFAWPAPTLRTLAVNCVER